MERLNWNTEFEGCKMIHTFEHGMKMEIDFNERTVVVSRHDEVINSFPLKHDLDIDSCTNFLKNTAKQDALGVKYLVVRNAEKR